MRKVIAALALLGAMFVAPKPAAASPSNVRYCQVYGSWTYRMVWYEPDVRSQQVYVYDAYANFLASRFYGASSGTTGTRAVGTGYTAPRYMKWNLGGGYLNVSEGYYAGLC